MATLNRSFNEISCKIVYYGPGLGGKTTNLEVIHGQIPNRFRGDLVSLESESERTLFFDFMPLNLGDVQGMKTKFQLYTVPGQVFYNATRKLVLRNVDAIVFVADSQAERLDENRECMINLRENLADFGYDLDSIPWVMQYNKRDLPNCLDVDALQMALNPGVDYFEAIATEGTGVRETLRSISVKLLKKLRQQMDGEQQRPESESPVSAAPRSVEPPPLASPSAPPSAPSRASDGIELEMEEIRRQPRTAVQQGVAAQQPRRTQQPKPEPPRPAVPQAPQPQYAVPSPVQEQSVPPPVIPPVIERPVEEPVMEEPASSTQPMAVSQPAEERKPEKKEPPVHIVQKCDVHWLGMRIGSARIEFLSLEGDNGARRFQLNGDIRTFGFMRTPCYYTLKQSGSEPMMESTAVAQFLIYGDEDEVDRQTRKPTVSVYVKNAMDRNIYIYQKALIKGLKLTPAGKPSIL